MNKFKFHDIHYLQGDRRALHMVNCKRFKKMSVISQEDNVYECAMAKKHLSIDLPIQLALTILQLSKLRMLKLYYSYLDYYNPRSDF